MFTATLIADGTLDDAVFSEIGHQFQNDFVVGTLTGQTWLDEGFAGDLTFDPTGDFDWSACAKLADAIKDATEAIALGGYDRELKLDVVVQPTVAREKRLLVADMDSTMITVECIDELADYAGIKAEIAAVTETAMRGELDFAAALDARVALLAGLDEGAIERCLAERVTIMPGAKALVRTMRARGATCVLVSGGFTRFAAPVAAEIGFDRAIANVLEVADGKLAGTVARPIVGAETKLATLEAERARLGVAVAATLAVGDGANDLPMIRAAGLGVAYRAKPVVAAAAGARVEFGDLSTLLWAQGIPRRDWITD